MKGIVWKAQEEKNKDYLSPKIEDKK